MSTFFPSRNADKILWVIHGDENQCLDEFMVCIKLFHWSEIDSKNVWPELIQFDCPHVSNYVHSDRVYRKIKFARKYEFISFTHRGTMGICSPCREQHSIGQWQSRRNRL